MPALFSRYLRPLAGWIAVSRAREHPLTVDSFKTKAPITALTTFGPCLVVHHRWSREVFVRPRGRLIRLARIPLPGKGERA